MAFKFSNDHITKLDFKHPATWTGTWFGFGLMQPAPGTWGTIGALPLGLLLMAMGPVAILIGLAIIIPLGLWSAEKMGAMLGQHDHSIIVIDEVAGLWITLLACTMNPISIILAVVFFRLFDILKPWPVSFFDKKVAGAKGVMLDDIAAGIYAAACLWGVNHYALIG